MHHYHIPHASSFSHAIRRSLIAFILLLTVTGSQAQTLPPNIDFSMSNFTNWLCYTGTSVTGTAATGPYFSSPLFTGPVATQHTITSGTGLDPTGGFPVVAPGGGLYSAMIGDIAPGYVCARARYNVRVPVGTTKFSIQTMFAVVFDDPGHAAADQPAFQVVSYDSATGAIIPSANNLFIAAYNIPGFITATTGRPYLPWTASTVNLGGMGGRTVTVEINALDCALGGHGGYGYFDITGLTNYLAPVASNCNMLNHTIRFTAPAGYKYYQWYNQSFSTALNSSADTNRNITLPLPSSSQYYNVVLIPYNSLGIPDTIRTNVLSPGFSASASSGTTTCTTPGSPVQLTTTVTGSSVGLKYHWYLDTATLSAVNIANPIASPTHLSHYYVAVTDTNGCVAGDTVTLLTGSYHVNAGPDRTTCMGTAINLNATVTPTSTAYTYSWLPAPGTFSNASIANPVYTAPSSVGTHSLVLRVDSAACSVFDTLNVRTLADTFYTSSAVACAGDSIMLSILGDTAFTYTWTPATKLTFPSPATAYGNQHPGFIADTTTTFAITAQYPGCSSKVNHLTVFVQPVPLVSIGADTVYKSVSTPLSLSTSVTPTWYNSYAYSWSDAPFIDSPSKANVNYFGTNDTMIYVTVTTPHGCTGHDSVYVINAISPIVAPNAFVPSSLLNGSFRIVQVQPGYTFHSMRIYDRSGRKLFESTKANEGWDGTYKGSPMPMGVYIYLLQADETTNDRRLITQKGNVTLLR